MDKGRTALLLVALLVAAPLLAMLRAPPSEPPADGQATAPIPPTTISSPEVTAALSRLSGSFEENRGQLADPAVRLFTRGGPLSVGFMRGGVVYTLRAGSPGDAGPPGRAICPGVVSFTMLLEGSNPVEPVGAGPLGHASNYLIGNDPDRWVTGAPSFQEVLYRGVYNGVDLRFLFKDGALKYEYACERASDASRIRHRYVGTEGIGLDPATGDLLVQTRAGVLRDMCPVMMGGPGGVAEGVRGAFAPLEGAAHGFALPEGLQVDGPVVIDPGLIWSTYYGGSDYDSLSSIVECEDGSIILGGGTASVDFPTKAAFDDKGNTSYGVADGAIVKLDPSGWPILSTYIGGNGTDTVQDLLLGPDGTVSVTGYTNSSDFPVSKDAMESELNWQYDMFLLRMSEDCTSILYGTFLGGSGFEYFSIIRAARDGSIYCAFLTNSTDINTTPGAYCSTFVGDIAVVHSIVVMQFDATLKNVTYCTYINGVLLAARHLSASVGPS